MLAWIQQRVTCHTPDKDGSPELHRLVTRYQLHKCSSYCKRRKKCGKHAFITRCKFGFPRPVPKLNPVQDSLKSRTRIYKLARTEAEFRVNDYNPLLLLLNIDIQSIVRNGVTNHTGLSSFLGFGTLHHWMVSFVVLAFCLVKLGSTASLSLHRSVIGRTL